MSGDKARDATFDHEAICGDLVLIARVRELQRLTDAQADEDVAAARGGRDTHRLGALLHWLAQIRSAGRR